MAKRSIWEVVNTERAAELVIIYDVTIALVEDGERLWIADAALLRKAIEWARITQIDTQLATEECPVWLVSDIRLGDDFRLDIFQCTDALERWGFGHLVPAFWAEDWEMF